MNQDTSSESGQRMFSGSELIFLHGDQFAPVAGALTVRVQLLHADIKVAAHELGEAMLAAAILGYEASGGVSLAIRSKKALLGLRTVNILIAEPAGGGAVWPEHSLEARIQAVVREGAIEVSELVYRVLGEDETNPWTLPIEIAQRGLHQRGLLDVEEGRFLKVLKTHHYKLPDRTAARAQQFSLDEIHRLLKSVPGMRPELWSLLIDQISKGVKRRKKIEESSDD